MIDKSLDNNESAINKINNPLRNLKDLPTLEIDKLKDFKEHPFEYENEGHITETADSISNVGLLHPITIRPLKDIDSNRSFTHEILNGHTRARAFKKLRDLGYVGYDKIAVIIRED